MFSPSFPEEKWLTLWPCVGDVTRPKDHLNVQAEAERETSIRYRFSFLLGFFLFLLLFQAPDISKIKRYFSSRFLVPYDLFSLTIQTTQHEE